ncbi:MAG TPA: O-antigen ligase family protein [Longimicrobiales bacterium]|nr:O-antigen ligase family protein [Longimicrobiales bacterium]
MIAVGVSYGIVHQPWLLIGVVVGAIVLAVAIAAPLALIAITLMLGGVDLSFMTGGFKALFPEMGGLDMNGIRLVGATIGFAVYIMNAPAGRGAIFGRSGLPYLIFLTYAFITLSQSFDPLEGLRLHMKLAYPFLTFLLVIGLCDTREKVEKLANLTLIAGAIIIFVVTPLYTLKSGYHVDYAGFRRVRSVGGGENSFSFYLMILMFLAFARLIYRKQLRYIVFCAGAIIWIMATMTRITFLASLVGIALISLLSAVAQKQYKAVAGGLIVTLMLALPGFPFILERSLGFVPGPREVLGLIANPIVLYESINWQGRTNLWPIVWSGFMAAPIFGLGLGSSGVVIREHFPAEAAQVAHNEYLRLAADTGMVGVILFAIAMFVWLGTGLAAARRAGRAVAEYAMPAVAGVVAWGIIAITDNPFDSYMYYTQYVGFLMGAMMALRMIAAREQHGDRGLS